MTEQSMAPRPGAYRSTVVEQYNGLRLDHYLAEAHETFSRSMAKRLIDLGGVHLAGRRVRRSSQAVSTGQAVEVFVDKQPLKPMTLDHNQILYRDQDLIVINKPAGMPTQPAPSRYQGTVYSELQKLLQNPNNKAQKPSIGMVQRLDLDTSGVLVFSINKRAHKMMTEAFRDRDVDKTYWALVAGRPGQREGAFSSQLAKRRATNLMVSVERGGKQADTLYRTLQTTQSASLVEVELITGRTHQIRAHFSAAGLPLLGDAAYGGPKKLHGIDIPRQMLHSRELTFTHPVTARTMTFNAPLPNDFLCILKHLDACLNGLD